MHGTAQRIDCAIVHYGDPSPTVKLAYGLAEHRETNVWVVDNSANLPVRAAYPFAVLRPTKNLGFGAATNLAVSHGTAPWIFVVNPDVTTELSAIDALRASLAMNPSYAVLAPFLAYPDGRPQLNGGQFSGWKAELVRATGLGYRLRGVRSLIRSERVSRAALIPRGWVSGAAMMIRRQAFDAIGGFDESFFLYFEDEDLCRRLRKLGWRVGIVPRVRMRHLVGGSDSGPSRSRHPAYEASRAAYHRRHSGVLLRRFVAFSARRRLCDSG